eukprot:CAMPEP_0113671920 /NCGR_PEP_ID=MMETSP0038_2-20120614/5964_1 /TAXON_ID=2898 /ORGANISM="Cryptomonas paramecium" /LENGTH=368 /DNA_ID=CAMNT_0000588109 /DNA_START=175 /DNA_END=1277 /DNA_ORIENTATION=- /assembly_acc=CAM_ASM_000170
MEAASGIESVEPKSVTSENADDDKSSSGQDFSTFQSSSQQQWTFGAAHGTVSTQPPVVDEAGGGYSFPQSYEASGASSASAAQTSFFAHGAAGTDPTSTANGQFFGTDQWYNLSCSPLDMARGVRDRDRLAGFDPGLGSADDAMRHKRRRRGEGGSTKKDPNRLRRPINAFLIWFHSHYKEITEGKTGLSFGDKMRLGAEIWAAKPIEEKDIYEQEHQRMRQNWIEAKNRLESGDPMLQLSGSDLDDPLKAERLMAGHVEVKKRRRRTPESAKDPNRLRRPINAFLLWFHSNYKEVCERRPGSTRGENMRIGAEMWAEKSAEEKEVYEQEYNRLRLEWLDQKTRLEASAAAGPSSAGGAGAGMPVNVP